MSDIGKINFGPGQPMETFHEPKGKAIMAQGPIGGFPAQRPVSSQLERIEQGLDALLQGQAAMAKELGLAIGHIKSEVELLRDKPHKMEPIQLNHDTLELWLQLNRKLKDLLDLQQQRGKAARKHGKARHNRTVRADRALGVAGRRAGKSR